jgi:acyl-CoA thioester hydrolase
MEQARCDMLDKLNYTYTDMRDDGYAYPVAKMNVKYIKPAEFGDILTVKSEIVSVEPSLDIKYVVFNKKTGEKIFEASTMQIGIDTQTRKSIYTPPARLVQALERIKNEKN